jgi:membrane protein
MSRKQAIQQKLKIAMKAAETTAKKIYHGEEEVAGGILTKIFNAAKVFVASTRKFFLDDCLTKASAITYTIILSLVPMLTVALTILSLYHGVGKNKKELFDRILLLMSEYNIKMNIDPIIDTILGLVENAGKIGGISAAVMVFSATALFRSLEKSLNDIWNVRKGRPLLLKIIYYWAALTLGPVMLAAGLYVSTQLSAALSSPNYHASAVTAGGRMWVVGDRSTVRFADQGKDQFEALNVTGGAINFENQRVYRYDVTEKTFIEQDAPVEPGDLRKTKFRGIQFIGNRGWIVGTNGIILATVNGGSRWSIRKYSDFNFNDIRMLNERRGFIATDSGRLFSTADGGASWEIQELEGQPNITSIAFSENTGIITGSRGVIFITNDGGNTWEKQILQGARRQNRYATIAASYMQGGKKIWLAGGDGTLLVSEDGGKSWTSRKCNDVNYHTIFFINSEEGAAGGDKGKLVRTDDGGTTWSSVKLPMMGINSMLLRDGRLWAVGDAGTIMASHDRGATWRYVKKGRTFAFTIINFLAPFAIIWLLFLMAYITLPNTKVPFAPAALGASFTSALWVLFIMGFSVYIKSFAGSTFAIYGALAGVPLFLLIVYASSLIILYGAEVAYTLMHPETYHSLKKSRRDASELRVYLGIDLITLIYRSFESGKGASSKKELGRTAACGPKELDLYLRLFVDAGLIVQDAEGNYMPAGSSANIRVNRVIDAILNISLDMPAPAGTSPSRVFLGKLFNRITSSRRKVVGKLTLKELMDKE